MIAVRIARLAIIAAILVAPPAADAQQPRPRPAARPQARSRSIEVGGYAMVGRFSFAAKESFDAVLGAASGPIIGGGARIGIPFGGLFVDAGVWRYQDDGERVFVLNDRVFPLNVPTEITVTPIEISAGWRFRFRRMPRVLPYVGGGLTSMRYAEASSFATEAEKVDETFSGYHLFAGAEYKVTRWLGFAGEAGWTTVADAIGESGVSAAFNEDNLGGVSMRFKVTVGR
jgi:opacity protein-like surface antigen